MAEALGVASSVIAVVDLSAKVFSLCLQYSREVKNAKADIEKLSKEVATLQATAKELQTLVEGPRNKELKASQRLNSAIEYSFSRLEKLEKQLQPSTGRKRMSRFGIRALKWPIESKEVKETIEDLERCRGTLSLALNIDQTAILQNVDDRTTLNQLPIAHGASFDSKAEEHNPTCLPDTRQDLLEDIDRWIDDPNSKTVYWLNGMAGTGKSTISRTVAHSRSERCDLSASFFFKRGEMDRGNLNKLMSTLAYQLALNIPGVAFFIKKTLDANQAVVGKSLKEQFQKLIQEPLSEAAATATTPPSVVMVIDALDECDQEADIRSLINIFSQAKTIRSRLRVFLTSRPELPIRLGFREVEGSYQDLVLHEIPEQIVEHDIFVFLHEEFRKIRYDFNLTVCDERKLPSDWPGCPTVQRLAQMAVPLFIFAATVCRFVGDRKHDSPPRQLRKVLDYKSKGHVSQLDLTYGPVLRSLIIDVSEDDKKEIIKDFRIIVGTIIILANPLSVLALSQLLELDPGLVDNKLDTLHSVLRIPPTRKASVRLLHLSFRDYLITKESEFRVDERQTHQGLAKQCIRVMRSALHENICGLSFPGARRSTVKISELEERIPLQVQYACMHWAYHHIEGDPMSNNHNEVYDFLKTHFLHWMEALSLMGRVKECLDSLRSLAGWLENREDSSLSNFIADAVRFIQAYVYVIAEAPLQIYSCMAFAPSKSIVRRSFEHAIPTWISNLPKVEEDWDACLLVLEGHSELVQSLVFSHDSTKLASASHDKTARVWDVKTGKCENMLQGHRRWIDSIIFLEDSKSVASNSSDGEVHIWDANTGKVKHYLEAHSLWISSSVFSNDLMLVASSSLNGVIEIWDAKTRERIRMLEGHSESARSMVFSHDSTLLASGSRDNTVRIWNVSTGKCKHLMKGHDKSITSMVFSDDLTLLASGSSDGTTRIWDLGMGKCKHALKDNGQSVNSVVFSRNSSLVASGSDDATVRIWDAMTGDCISILEGHSQAVRSVAFSHDSTLLASGSEDKTVRIWDTKPDKYKQMPEGHTKSVWSVALSKDSMLVASGSCDKTVRIWDGKEGGCKHVMEGHTNSVRSVAFSDDSTLLASGSSDGTVRIWAVETGNCESVLKGHSKSINSVVFSHNSSLVASGSDDQAIRIWDIRIGECKRVLEGHDLWVISVVFSDNSTMIASGSSDKMIRVWDANTGDCEHVLEGHTEPVYSVVISHDSVVLASASYDKTVRIWDISKETCRNVMSLNSSPNLHSFTPDDGGIITGIGVLTLSGDNLSSTKLSTVSQPTVVPILGLHDETWVTMAGRDLLWLPAECREGKIAIASNKVVIGCESGRVIILGFCASETERLCIM